MVRRRARGCTSFWLITTVWPRRSESVRCGLSPRTMNIPGEEYDGHPLHCGDFAIRSLPHTIIVNQSFARAFFVMIEGLGAHGVEIQHAWGMTEMSPIGTIRCLSPEAAKLPPAERDALRAKQGRTVFGVELKITDEEGKVEQAGTPAEVA